jgi:hypothetical protein
VDKAIEKYEQLGEKVFGKKLPWLTRWDATYDHSILESCLKEVIRGSPLKLNGEELLKDETRRCRTFVISTNLEKHSLYPAILRSYDVPRKLTNGVPRETIDDTLGETTGDVLGDTSNDVLRNTTDAYPVKIWQAGRATSAAPTFFKHIVINNESYSDGATIANNPSYYGIMEASSIWKPTDIDCILSLGTGPEGDHTLDNATREFLGPCGMWFCKKMLSRFLYFRLQLAFYSLHGMTRTEDSHRKAKDMVDTYRGNQTGKATESSADTPDEVYFRLNIEDKDAKVGLDAWQKMENLKILAGKYM